MAPSKVAILSIFLALIFSQVRADHEQRLPAHETTVTQSDGPHPVTNGRPSLAKSIKTEASHIIGRITGPKKNTPRKNGVSPEEYEKLQKIISSLRSEIESLQKNGSLVEQQVGKAQARADELEKEVNELEQKLQSQSKEKEDLESRANEAEKKINDLLSEIQNTRKTNDEQETKIRKTEHALEVKVAEVIVNTEFF